MDPSTPSSKHGSSFFWIGTWVQSVGTLRGCGLKLVDHRWVSPFLGRKAMIKEADSQKGAQRPPIFPLFFPVTPSCARGNGIHRLWKEGLRLEWGKCFPVCSFEELLETQGKEQIVNRSSCCSSGSRKRGSGAVGL